MYRLLVVEDALETQKVLRNTFAKDYAVTFANTATEAQEKIRDSTFDLILLDVGLPDGDGFKFCATIKKTAQANHTPIVFLTGKTEIGDKVMGLSLGGSDYITKPFSPIELRARVDAHLRDTAGKKNQAETLHVSDLCFYVPNQRVSLISESTETPLELTPLEFKLLYHLAKHPDQVFTRDQLLTAAWGSTTYVVDRVVDVHISNLRKKLNATKSTVLAVHGVGYRFNKIS